MNRYGFTMASAPTKVGMVDPLEFEWRQESRRVTLEVSLLVPQRDFPQLSPLASSPL